MGICIEYDTNICVHNACVHISIKFYINSLKMFNYNHNKSLSVKFATLLVKSSWLQDYIHDISIIIIVCVCIDIVRRMFSFNNEFCK